MLKSLLFGYFQKHSLSAGCQQWRTSTDSFTVGFSSPLWLFLCRCNYPSLAIFVDLVIQKPWIANSTYLIGGLAGILMRLDVGITLLGAQVSFTSQHRTIKIIKYVLIHGTACWREVGELWLLLTAVLCSFHFLWCLQTENAHSSSPSSTLEIKHRMDNFGLESTMELFYFWGHFIDCFHPGIF